MPSHQCMDYHDLSFSSTAHVLFIGLVLKHKIWLQLSLNSQPTPRFKHGTPDHDLFTTSNELDGSAMGPDFETMNVNKILQTKNLPNIIYYLHVLFFVCTGL